MKTVHPHNDTWKAGFHAYRNICYRRMEGMNLDDIPEHFKKKAGWFAGVEGLIWPPEIEDADFIYVALKTAGFDLNEY